MLLGGPEIQHYHQAIAIVIAETFEQARAAAALVRVDYARGKGRFDLDEALKIAPLKGNDSGEGSKAPAGRPCRQVREARSPSAGGQARRALYDA